MRTEPDRVPGKVKTKMKKLMFVATAALCAAVGFGDITSQNVVGYTTKAAAETGNRYVTATFVRVDGEKTDLQKDFQLDASVPTGAANIQLLDRNGIKTVIYHWVEAADCASQSTPIALKNAADTGAWGIMDSYYDEEEEMDVVFYKPIPETVTIAAGDAFQLYSTIGKSAKIFAPYEL